MQVQPIIVWLRRDLRIDDNPALHAAAKEGSVLPLFIWCPEEEGKWAPGEGSRFALHQALTQLESKMPLLIRHGKSLDVLQEVCKKVQAKAVYFNRCYEPYLQKRDAKIKEALQKDIEVHTFNSALLFEPWTVQNKQGNPFKVFTPFWKHCQEKASPKKPLPSIKTFFAHTLTSQEVPLLANRTFDMQTGDLKRFVRTGLQHYDKRRDRPDLSGTSQLSTTLHFGQISPRQVWHAASGKKGAAPFLRQLMWREFAYHLLFHFPNTPEKPLYEKYVRFPWVKNKAHLRAWQEGMTGYPFVDAGMRQLQKTGWMHNRLRLVVGSFLVKDLLINWLEGAKWFWENLTDADLANNTLGWQWVAGCGADAAPYYRIFNPITQGEKFDPKGDFVRQWLPELKGVPAKDIHQPWKEPIVDHKEARERALDALEAIK